MPQSAQSNPFKRLRVASPSAEVPNSVTMSDEPLPDLGGGTARSPTHQTGSVDIESFLLDVIQTETGATELAHAMKDRRVRDVLKQHGIKIQADDDVGYNSLPLELRDQIRRHVIADLERDEAANRRRKCCPRIATYACVDTEWRTAIEPITFRSLHLRRTRLGLDEDLDLFASYVVGNRRQYLQHIHLPCTIWQMYDDFDYNQDADFVSTRPIRRLFNCLEQWHEVATRDTGFYLELAGLDPVDWRWTPARHHNELRNELVRLPELPHITRVSYSGQADIHFGVLLAVTSRLPKLRYMSIHNLGFQEWAGTGGGQNSLSSMQVLFNTLSNTVPSLEGLEASTRIWHRDFPLVEYMHALMSYSQKLRKLSLMHTSKDDLLECLAPFSAENFDSHALPLLSWPNLTNISIDKIYVGTFYADDAREEEENIEEMNQLVLSVGRAIRYMPLIQSLDMGLDYVYERSDAYSETHLVLFKLELSWDDSLNGSRAKLTITHDWVYSNVAEAVPSEEAKELWRESLLKGANAVLDIEVVFKEGNEDEDRDKDV